MRRLLTAGALLLAGALLGGLALAQGTTAARGGRQTIGTDICQFLFKATGNNAVFRTVCSKVAETVSVCDYEQPCPNGVNDAAAFQAAAIAASSVLVPAGTFKFCGTLPSNVRVVGAGRAATTLSCTTAAWGVDLTDTQNSGLESLTISLGASALGGVRLRGNALTSEMRAILRDVNVTAVSRTVGQVGYLLQSDLATSTPYHNSLNNLLCNQMDVCLRAKSLVSTQGPNGTTVNGLQALGQNICLDIQDSTDSSFLGINCLGGASNPIAIKISVGGGFGVSGNTFQFVSEQGPGATTVSVASGVGTTLGNGNNLFIGQANDATQITDAYGGSAVNANKYFLTSGILVPRIQGSPPSSPLLLFGSAAGSVLVGDGTVQPTPLAGLGVGVAGGAFVTVGDGTREAFIGADTTSVYVGSLSGTTVSFRVGNVTQATLDSAANLTLQGTGFLGLGSVTQAQLGAQPNGTLRYCSDCTVANPCAAAGTGALAKRVNGVWVCN